MFTQKFPFGKFRNVELHKVDTPYLVYALENFELSDDLKHAISKVVFHKLRVHEYFKNILSNVSDESDVTALNLSNKLLMPQISDDEMSNLEHNYFVEPKNDKDNG